jgi:transcriptional regulator with XRE-family HTH domain
MSTDNTIHEVLIRNMKRFREAKGWKKSDLARATGIDASHISNLENGKKHIGLELMEKIAIALEVEPFELIREYDPERMNLGEKLNLVEQLPEIKRIAIEQMVNAFITESNL